MDGVGRQRPSLGEHRGRQLFRIFTGPSSTSTLGNREFTMGTRGAVSELARDKTLWPGLRGRRRGKRGWLTRGGRMWIKTLAQGSEGATQLNWGFWGVSRSSGDTRQPV